MAKYVILSRGYSDKWTWSIKTFHADRFTKRHYDEVLRLLRACLDVTPKGSYAIVYRAEAGSPAKKVLEINVLTYISNWPEITTMIFCNDYVVRAFPMAE